MSNSIIGEKSNDDYAFTSLKYQSFIHKPALNNGRTKRLKQFQFLEKSIQVKKIHVKKPFHFCKKHNKQNNTENNIEEARTLRVKETQNQISTIQSLKNKIKVLEKDDHQVQQPRIKNFNLNSTQRNHLNTEKQVREMLEHYRTIRKKAGQYRSQRTLQTIQIKSSLDLQRQKSKVKTLQLNKNNKQDLMKSVYLKLVDQRQEKSFSMRENSRKTLSLTAKRFYEQKQTNYGLRTQTSMKTIDSQRSLIKQKIPQISLCMAKHKYKIKI